MASLLLPLLLEAVVAEGAVVVVGVSESMVLLLDCNESAMPSCVSESLMQTTMVIQHHGMRRNLQEFLPPRAPIDITVPVWSYSTAVKRRIMFVVLLGFIRCWIKLILKIETKDE